MKYDNILNNNHGLTCSSALGFYFYVSTLLSYYLHIYAFTMSSPEIISEPMK